MKTNRKILKSKNEQGFIAAATLLITVFMATMAIVMLNVHDATMKDSASVTQGIQAKFLAESAIQEAKYYVTQVGAGWTGTSAEQSITAAGKNVGSFDYTVTNNGSAYTVVANGYVPNKTDPKKIHRSLTSTFNYLGLAASGGIVVLNATAASSLAFSGNGGLVLYGGKIYVNSNSASGMNGNGNASLTASEFNLGGSAYAVNGNPTVNGTVKYNQVPIADPFATLAVPDPDALTLRSNGVLSIGNNTTTTLNPGVYVGGIALSGNAVVTMNPGIYYLKTGNNGKGFTVSGNATVTGNQVVFYNEAVGANEILSLSGNGAITLTPPTSGTYNSVAYFQSRTSTRASTIIGNGQLKVRGALYLKAATLNISGNGSNIGSLLVSDKCVISGNGGISINNY